MYGLSSVGLCNRDAGITFKMHSIYQTCMRKSLCLSVCWHLEQQGRHVVFIKDSQTDGCRVRKKEKTQYNVAYS